MNCDNCNTERVGGAADLNSTAVIFVKRIHGHHNFFFCKEGCLREWAAREL